MTRRWLAGWAMLVVGLSPMAWVVWQDRMLALAVGGIVGGIAAVALVVNGLLRIYEE